MGGGHKLLLPFGDSPLIRSTVRTALASGTDEVAAVTGARASDVATALEGLSIQLLENPDYETGQASSVSVAIDWAESRADGLLLLLGDEPAIDPAIVRRAVEAWRDSPSVALRVRYADRPGHPVIVPLPVPEDRRPTGDTGMRTLLGRVVEFSVARPAPVDVDTEAHYREALARLRQ